MDCKNCNFAFINQIFLPFEAKEMKPIPLSFRFPKDRLIWHFSKDSLYEVKGGYQLAFHHLHEPQHISTSNSGMDSLWTKIWNLNIFPKIKYFVWREISNTLPVKVNLIKMGVSIDDVYSCYDSSRETTDHILKDYLWSSRLWLLCPLGLVVDSYVGSDFGSWLAEDIALRSLNKV